MELAAEYIDICRHDPDRMDVTIRNTRNEMQRIVHAYSNGIMPSYNLKNALKEILTGYLIKNRLCDLFRFSLKEGEGRIIKELLVDVKFIGKEDRKK